MLQKYLKPKSVTWWSGFVPICCGAFVAFEPVHQLAEWADAVSTMYGDVPPAVPINAGLALIGLRGTQS